MTTRDTPATGRPTRPEAIASDLCWLLDLASRRQEREFSHAGMTASGLTARQHRILVAAADASRTQKEIADAIGLDTTTVALTVDELERAGLAERHVAPADRRARMIVVTAAGRRAARRCDEALAATQERMLSGLSADQRTELMGALEHLAFPGEA